MGAKPAAISKSLRSRSGTLSCSARRNTMARLACDRPVSMKLRWRVEMSTSVASSSWLRWRRWRQARSSSPNGRRCFVMKAILAMRLRNAFTSKVIGPPVSGVQFRQQLLFPVLAEPRSQFLLLLGPAFLPLQRVPDRRLQRPVLQPLLLRRGRAHQAVSHTLPHRRRPDRQLLAGPHLVLGGLVLDQELRAGPLERGVGAGHLLA